MTLDGYITRSRFIGLFLPWCLLFSWQQTADRVGCLGCLLFLIPLWLSLMLAASEIALFKRQTFINQYLNPTGILAHFWRRPTLTLIWQSFKALVFSLMLLVSAVLFDPLQWLVLLADIGVMLTLIALMAGWLRRELKPHCLQLLTLHWAQCINAVLLWLSFILILFFSAHENYLGMSWEEAVRYSASRIVVACDALAVLTRINAVSEALMWWVVQNRLNELQHPLQVLIAWLAFIATYGASFVMAWAYSRALSGTLSRPWRITFSELFSA
jgi:hypothetical protein